MTVDDRFTEEARQQRIAQAQLGTVNEIVTGPVTDWTTDFSHMEPEYAENAIEVWDDLRERCPIARTERFGGAWLPTRYEDVAAIAYDTEHFTSRAIIASNVRPPLDVAPVGLAPSTAKCMRGNVNRLTSETGVRPNQNWSSAGSRFRFDLSRYTSSSGRRHTSQVRNNPRVSGPLSVEPVGSNAVRASRSQPISMIRLRAPSIASLT